MTNMNEKVFVHNKTGNKYYVVNVAVGYVYELGDVEDMVVFTSLGTNETNWHVTDYFSFMEDFTEQVQ